MLVWDGWKAQSRQYLIEAGAELDLHETLLGYYNDVHRFQQRFGGLVLAANREAISETQALANRGNALTPDIERQLRDPNIKGIEIPYISGSFNQRRG